MKNVLVTGANGFIGKNLITALSRRRDDEAVNIVEFTSSHGADELADKVQQADLIFHLAGANRPPDEKDFDTVNRGLTEQIVKLAVNSPRKPAIVFSSTIQAIRDNAYGKSKLAAEEVLIEYQKRSGKSVAIYRLPNVFGKWSRPNYNTVVATFCHNISRGKEIQINDPEHKMTLVYVDEVVRCFSRHLTAETNFDLFCDVDETFEIAVGELANRIRDIHKIRSTLEMPDLSDRLTKYLYTTHLSFLPEEQFSYNVNLRTDDRGWLFELIKSEKFGQIFVSTTKPGITRGNHYHDTKVEKFCLIQGRGVVRFRLPGDDEILEYPVDDQQIKIVDIPPGFTHSIENTGEQNMIVLFWANEIFNPDEPDTYWIPVIQ